MYQGHYQSGFFGPIKTRGLPVVRHVAPLKEDAFILRPGADED